MEYSTGSDSSDPASWDKASYSAHPVDSLEPLPENTDAYREACRKFLRVFLACDTYMCSSRDARLAWIQISIACGLPGVQGRTETAIAAEIGITKQALSRGVAKFLRMSSLSPAFGLKSPEAQRAYQKCH